MLSWEGQLEVLGMFEMTTLGNAVQCYRLQYKTAPTVIISTKQEVDPFKAQSFSFLTKL